MGKRSRNVSHSEFPILDGLGLYAAATKGDGNCLFRALSDQIHGDESKHHEIRQAVVEYVEKNGDHFSAFVGEYGETFDQYISRLRQDGVYGGHIEIVAFAEVFGRQVVIYQSDNLYIVQPDARSSSDINGSVHIAYHSWEHYSSVRQIGGPRNGPVHIDIPQSSELADINIANETAGDSQTIPLWKVDIVMKSVPDANEEKVKELLKTKDYDEVIEELLMSEFTDEDGTTKIQDAILTNTEKSPNLEKSQDSEKSQNLEMPVSESRSDKPREPEDAEHSKRILTSKDRKLAAKQRRQEKKERVRNRKQKTQIAAAADDAVASGSKPVGEKKLDVKIVHI